MNIEEALNQLVQETLEKVGGEPQITSTECMPASLGKSIGFNIPVDGGGRGHYETSVTGLAFVIKKNVTAVINSPKGIFSLHVTSSAGTNENFSNVHTGQQISCTIRIKGKTLIAIDISSSIPNTTVNGTLSY